MIRRKSSTFDQIKENNLMIDESIETMVETACIRDTVERRSDREQLEKTSRLLFLSSLVLSENDSSEDSGPF